MSRNQIRTFFSQLGASKAPAPLYWLGGNEVFILDEAWRAVLAKSLPDGDDSLNHERMDAARQDSDQLLLSAKTMPFFSDRRVITIDNANAIPAKSVKLWQRYMDNPTPTTVVILRAPPNPKRNRRYKPPKHLQTLMKLAGDGALQIDALSEDEVRDWLIRRRAPHWRLQLQPEAAELMLAVQGTSLSQLDAALERIDLSIGDSPDRVVDTELARELLYQGRQYSIFELSDTLMTKNLEGSLHILRSLLEDMSPQPIAMQLTRLARQLCVVGAPSSRGLSPGELASISGAPPFKINSIRRAAARWAPERLEQVLAECHLLEVSLRSSKVTPSIQLEQALFSFCR